MSSNDIEPKVVGIGANGKADAVKIVGKGRAWISQIFCSKRYGEKKSRNGRGGDSGGPVSESTQRGKVLGCELLL